MYYIEVGLGPKFRPLATFFSCCGLVGCLCMFQANQLAVVLDDNHGIDRRLTAVVLTVAVAAVVLGGLRRIAGWCEKLVPAMCVIYIVASLTVLALRVQVLPGVLAIIVKDAFTGSAMAGGVLGTVIVTGVKRAAFSNEAGIGTAPMAHGAAKTDEPIREGLVAMLGPFIDTLVICTMTALVILSSGVDYGNTGDSTLEGVTLTSRAFEASLGSFGALVVTASVALFAISTMFGYSYYGRKCLGYLLGQQRSIWYNLLYLPSLALGAVWSVGAVINLIDTSFALMAVPNMLATLLLAPRVTAAMRDYFARCMAAKD